jgi:hypothetical protein
MTISEPALRQLTNHATPAVARARRPRPVIKWAGGKRQVLTQLLAREPVSELLILDSYGAAGRP